ncbi:hypothetical protein [Flavobacterium sp. CECT 9288]|uniref:hypothetical protein n=1 Tax=Flavobacterium sp. CECT 9288 TaxID=2845819 RepID=UPI001E528564|nr:hypothetical protein [Flavobacterium sp. CECT 9288]
MKAKLGISNWNVNLKFALVGVVDNQLYAFKGISYPVSNSELKVTTKKEILDLYFEYEGKRLVPTDRVPYNSKTPTKIKMVAHTRNMMGEKIKFNAHALEDDSILENLSESTIKANGIAELSFQKKAPAHLKKDDTETYYAGVEGFSTKHFKDKTLVFKVGAKWDSGDVFDKNDSQLIWGAKVSKEFRLKVVKICKELWGNESKFEMANQLMICMNVETKGKFSASIGYPHATGLVQFTESAIKDMNREHKGVKYTGPDYKDKLLTKRDLKNMSEIRQLDFVKLYFQMHIERYKRVINNAEDMYMAIFAPIGVGKKGDDTLYTKVNSPDAYKLNKSADGEYWDYNEFKIQKGDKNEEITKNEMTPRIKQSIHLGKMYSIDIYEDRTLDVILAKKILEEKKITFSNVHPYKSTNDKANADDNIKDASEGEQVYTSEYGHAKGKQVSLSIGVLYVLHELSKLYKFNVQELAGASHSENSQHYRGTAIDINKINYKHVDSINFDESFFIKFTKEVKKMGAVNVYHPYWSATKSDRVKTERIRNNLKHGEKLVPISDHKDHIHIQF